MRGEPSKPAGRAVWRAAHMGGGRVSRKGSGSFFFLESLPLCLITFLKSVASYTPPSGFLWFSDSTCQDVRDEVKGQPELKERLEEVENQVEKSIQAG